MTKHAYRKAAIRHRQNLWPSESYNTAANAADHEYPDDAPGCLDLSPTVITRKGQPVEDAIAEGNCFPPVHEFTQEEINWLVAATRDLPAIPPTIAWDDVEQMDDMIEIQGVPIGRRWSATRGLLD